MPEQEATPGPRRQSPVLHQAPVAVAGRSPLAQAVSDHGGGTVRLVAEPTSGKSVATPLLASPWNVIGQGLPPSAGLSAARGVVYLGGANLTGPLTVLAVYSVAGALLTLAATAWRRHRVAARPLEPLSPTKGVTTCATAPSAEPASRSVPTRSAR